MGKKQHLASAFGIQRENWGNHAFFRDNKTSIWKKKPIHCFAILLLFRINVAKKFRTTPNFLSGFQ